MKKKLLRSFLIALITTSVLALVVGCTIALPTFDPSKLDAQYHTTIIYDKYGNEAMKLQPDNSVYVPLSKVSKYVVEGIIATEDNRFYEHNGINVKAMIRALYTDVISGSKEQGASTITQQLAKNVYLNQDKTFTRKIKEIFLAAQIERNYTKDEILEKYLNRIFFGPNAVGVEAASQKYFGKSAGELTLAEGALIAGLPQAPSLYNPLVNPDAAIERRNIVLDNMVKNGYISQEEADQAKKVPYKKPPVQKDTQNEIKYPYYLEYVIKEAADQYQIPEDQIMGGGLRIYTNLDPKIQSITQDEFSKDSNFPANYGKSQAQGAMTITDPKTGAILAMVGGRGEHQFGDFNRAFQMRRSPGSSIKPLVVYGPALDTGNYGPNSLLNDRAGSKFGDYQPNDWDGRGRGQVTMKEALRQSWNIPAVSLLQEIGLDTGKKFAEKAGIVFDDSDNDLSIALGGMKYGVSPLMMADAYDAFDNNGVRIPAHSIQKIQTESGSVIAEANPQPVQVMKGGTARTMTSLLQEVVREGTGTNAQLTTGQPVAGKTGSSEYGKESNRDAWFVGYTPKYVGAVWMGFDDSKNGENVPEGSKIAAKFFSKVMSKVTQGEAMTYFDAPPAQDTKKETKKSISLQAGYVEKRVQLSWSALDGNVLYNVFRADGEDGKNAVSLGTTTDTSFVDSTVDPAHGYVYYVTAVDPNNPGEELARSGEVSVPAVTSAKEKPDKKDKDKKGNGTGENTGGTDNGNVSGTAGSIGTGNGSSGTSTGNIGNGSPGGTGGNSQSANGAGNGGKTTGGSNGGQNGTNGSVSESSSQ